METVILPFHRMTDKTSIHFTEPFCISYSQQCTIFAELDPNSAKLMQQLFMQAFNNGDRDEDATPIREVFPENPTTQQARRHSPSYDTGRSSASGSRVLIDRALRRSSVYRSVNG